MNDTHPPCGAERSLLRLPVTHTLLFPPSPTLSLSGPHVIAISSVLQRVLTGSIQCPIPREGRGAETDRHEACPVVATKPKSWMANNEEPGTVPAWLRLNDLASLTPSPFPSSFHIRSWCPSLHPSIALSFPRPSAFSCHKHLVLDLFAPCSLWHVLSPVWPSSGAIFIFSVTGAPASKLHT